jgi:hypothetical protein
MGYNPYEAEIKWYYDPNDLTPRKGGLYFGSASDIKKGEISTDWLTQRYPDECPLKECKIMNDKCLSDDLSLQVVNSGKYCKDTDITNDYHNATTHSGYTWE